MNVHSLKEGVEVVRQEIKGRSLPLDDVTLDAISDAVINALDAYDDFNMVKRRWKKSQLKAIKFTQKSCLSGGRFFKQI